MPSFANIRPWFYPLKCEALALALALTLLALLTSLVISGVCTSSGGSSPGGGVTTWGVISGGGNLQGGNLRHSCRTVINRRRRIASSFATFSADKEQAQRPGERRQWSPPFRQWRKAATDAVPRLVQQCDQSSFQPLSRDTENASECCSCCGRHGGGTTAPTDAVMRGRGHGRPSALPEILLQWQTVACFVLFFTLRNIAQTPDPTYLYRLTEISLEDGATGLRDVSWGWAKWVGGHSPCNVM